MILLLALIGYAIVYAFIGAMIVSLWFVALCIVAVDWVYGKIVRRP